MMSSTSNAGSAPDATGTAADAKPNGSARRMVFLALLGVLIVYLLAAADIARLRAVWSPDTGARLIQVQSVLQHPPQWWIAYPARELDPIHQNSPFAFFEFNYNGRTYLTYSFLFALLSAAFFRAAGYLGLAFLPMLGGLGSALAVYGMARLLRFRYPLAPLLLVALATPVAVYSVVFWDHSVTTAIAAASLYLVLRAITTGRTWLWMAAGATLGAGFWFHEILLPFVPALLVAAWWCRRRVPWLRAAALFLLGVTLLTVPLLLINRSVYGTPFGPHLSNNRLTSVSSIVGFLLRPGEWGPGALYTLFFWGDSSPAYTWELKQWLQNPWPQLRHELNASYWMLTPVIAWVLLGVSGLWRRSVPLSLLTLGGLLASGVWVLRHGELAHSLFLTCPLLLFAFARAPREGREEGASADVRLLLQVIGLVTAIYTIPTIMKPTMGGTEWGARTLLAIVPGLVLLAWAPIERLLDQRGEKAEARRHAAGTRPLLVGMSLVILLSAALQVRGFRTARTMHERSRQVADAIARSPDDVILTSVWWVPMNAASEFYGGKRILFANGPTYATFPLFQRLRQAGVRSYTLLGFGPTDLFDAAVLAGYEAIPGAARPGPFGLQLNRFGLPGTMGASAAPVQGGDVPPRP